MLLALLLMLLALLLMLLALLLMLLALLLMLLVLLLTFLTLHYLHTAPTPHQLPSVVHLRALAPLCPSAPPHFLLPLHPSTFLVTPPPLHIPCYPSNPPCSSHPHVLQRAFLPNPPHHSHPPF